MGVFDRYKTVVERLGAELAPMIGGVLDGPGDDQMTWRISGTRGGRAVHVELDQMHGIYGVGCAIRELKLDSMRLYDDRSFFALDSEQHVAERVKASTIWDGPALWELLPEITRRAVVALLAPEGSSLTLRKQELSSLLGPVGALIRPDAVATIVRDLDRLLAIAPVLEECWDVDPNRVGGGIGGNRVFVPPPPQPAPARVGLRDAADIAARALPARDAMIARYADSILEPFPAVNPTSECGDVKDRVVVLPEAPRSRWVKDIGYRVLVAGDVERGWYFAATKGEAFARVLRAIERYEAATGTNLDDAAYAVIGRVTGDPRVAVVDRKGRVGLDVAVLGALVGDRVFIDATHVVDGESRFAGED